MSYWTGDKSTGVVRLIRCEQCHKPNPVKTHPKGTVPRKCNTCRAPKNTDHCDRCGKLILGHRRKYCTLLCRKEATQENAQLPEVKARKSGNAVWAKRGRVIHKCTVCGEPVDPRILSRWGFEERGLHMHESAGSHPSSETIDGPSCKDFQNESV